MDSAPPLRARVVLNEPVGLLDYRVPEELSAVLRPGMAVRVPLGKRRTSAYVTSLEVGPAPEGVTLKDLEGLDADRPALPPVILELVLFASSYYAATPGEVLEAALPAMARAATTRYVITPAGEHSLPLAGDTDRALLEVARKFSKGFTVAALERELGWPRRSATARAKKQVKNGWLTVAAKKKGGPRAIAAFQRTGVAAPETLKPKARALLELIPLGEPVPATELLRHDARAYERLKQLEKAGLVERSAAVQSVRPHAAPQDLEAAPTPTDDQRAAIDRIGAALDARTFATFLLEGVTGSGKTEVYLQLIERVLLRGQTALVLVPEIALTPQLGARFRARFGDRVATFHSGLTVAERRDEWERVARGEARIGLGARSALFLPLTDLGVVIVDEEHESSFKQDEAPRYNARDLAVFRARRENAVIVLGSATPSLESRGNADAGRYQLVRLPSRVAARPLPSVASVDLKTAKRVGSGIFTEELATKLDQTLAAGDQAVIFLNRRGFASYVYCRDCGHAFRCPSCDVSLTLHRRRGVLACHYCGYEEDAPDTCPKCLSDKVESFGLGTEKIELELRSLFGEVPLARLDRDTIRTRADLERALARFGGGEARVLVGTQMVAKGHDFPGVTLVGVVSADAGLNFPDFRAAERTFQLLTQVAGRAGRGSRAGSVLLQTYDAEHFAVRAAMKHDYERFAEAELELRRELGYPPFTHLALLRYEANEESVAMSAAQEAADRLRARNVDDTRVLGPALAPLSRIKGRYRVQVLIKAQTRAGLRALLASVKRVGSLELRQVVDVDPFTML